MATATSTIRPPSPAAMAMMTCFVKGPSPPLSDFGEGVEACIGGGGVKSSLRVKGIPEGTGAARGLVLVVKGAPSSREGEGGGGGISETETCGSAQRVGKRPFDTQTMDLNLDLRFRNVKRHHCCHRDPWY